MALTETPICEEIIKTRDGKETSRKLNPREQPPGVDLLSPRGMAGSVAASEVLAKGGKISDALDAAIAARQKVDERPVEADQPANPELEIMLRYIHAIARLHSGRFEDLTPQGMLEVAMLCPYPINSYEEWKQRLSAISGSK